MGVGAILLILALVCFLAGAVLALPRLAVGYALTLVAVGLALATFARLLGAA